MKTTFPKCLKCRNDKFELRVLREDAVAAARCATCSANYLLLDSKDYWFDVIQKRYPRITKCTCKCESFQLRIEYNVRADDDEIDYVVVYSICSTCDKSQLRLYFDVDYGGTSHLLKKPVVGEDRVARE